MAVIAGVAYGDIGHSLAARGIAAGDCDNDGDEDLLVTTLGPVGATLYVNEGRGNFTDVTIRSGLFQATLGVMSFGAGWLDYDNDGFLDLFLANGGEAGHGSEGAAPHPPGALLLRHSGAGCGLIETAPATGPQPGTPRAGRGAAFGDVDNDGD